jgi:hypothetical protein
MPGFHTKFSWGPADGIILYVNTRPEHGDRYVFLASNLHAGAKQDAVYVWNGERWCFKRLILAAHEEASR